MGNDREIVFEDSLSDEWSQDLGVVEVPLDERPLLYLAALAVIVGAAVAGRMLFLSFGNGFFYSARAEVNLFRFDRVDAPRGLIVDRDGRTLADNKQVFSAVLDANSFLHGDDALRQETLLFIQSSLAISPESIWQMIGERNAEGSGEAIVLSNDLTQTQLVALRAKAIPTVEIRDSFKREYPQGPALASVLGYLGYPTAADLKQDPALSGEDMVGKAGVESYYDGLLRGTPGLSAKLRDASGKPLGEEKKTDPKTGETLALSVDSEFQGYFYEAFTSALRNLGRTSGVGLAMNPKTGEVLAYLNFPSFDNNIFSASGKNAEKRELLTSPTRPLFPRAVSGLYNPGSTIKPLHAIAALSEGVIAPDHQIFSPGYLDVPNPYDAEHPSRFVDWRYQGNVDLNRAIAQSSNVYFYLVGGGSPVRDSRLGPEWSGNFGIKGLGIDRLRTWWEKFRLNEPTGIDLPGEEGGFLPSPDWKEKQSGRPWLLGDTYNVSIGQGDLSITPMELLQYISTIANNGVMHEPTVNKAKAPGKVTADLSEFSSEIKEVQGAMRTAVTSPEGTARLLNTLPFPVAGKTGSAQVQNNTQENAFFVGYAPFNDPQIAVLILVEHSKEGSLNAVPIANEVLYWYYINRLQK